VRAWIRDGRAAVRNELERRAEPPDALVALDAPLVGRAEPPDGLGEPAKDEPLDALVALAPDALGEPAKDEPLDALVALDAPLVGPAEPPDVLAVSRGLAVPEPRAEVPAALEASGVAAIPDEPAALAGLVVGARVRNAALPAGDRRSGELG
jgi:hypothetical protein